MTAGYDAHAAIQPLPLKRQTPRLLFRTRNGKRGVNVADRETRSVFKPEPAWSEQR